MGVLTGFVGSSLLVVDLGSRLTKAMELQGGRGEPRITRLGMALLRGEGETTDEGGERVEQSLKPFIQSLTTRRQKVVASVAGREVLSKIIRVKRRPEGDLREAIRWEVEGQIPFGGTDLCFDFSVLDGDERGPEVDVLVVAAKRRVVVKRFELLASFDLRVKGLGTDTVAILNAYQANYGRYEKGQTVLVNLGDARLNLVLLEDGRPKWLGDIGVGLCTLVSLLHTETGLSLDLCRSAVRGDPPPELGPDAYDPHVASWASDLIGRIRPLLLPRMAEAGGAPYRFYLSGGGAYVPRLKEALGEGLGCEVEVADPFRGLLLEGGAHLDAEALTCSALFMVAVGLGVGQVW